MGLNLSAPALHEENVRTIFRARSPGSWLLELLRFSAVIIIPIVASFHAGNMWLKHGVFVEDPFSTYTGRYLLRATDSAGNEYLHTSSEAVLDLLSGDPRNAAPFISGAAEDVNSDGRTDVYTFTIAIAPRTAAPITALQFLPSFEYEFSASNQVSMHHKMNAAPFIEATSSLTSNSGSTVHLMEGFLEFKQVNPLDAYYVVSYADVYAQSFLTDKNVQSVSDVRQIGKFASKYAMRNESLHFDMRTNVPTDVAQVDGDLSARTILSNAAATPDLGNGLYVAQIKMRVAPAVVDYIPAPSEVAMWAWVQWFSIGYPVSWLIAIFVGFLVRQSMVRTSARFVGRIDANAPY